MTFKVDVNAYFVQLRHARLVCVAYRTRLIEEGLSSGEPMTGDEIVLASAAEMARAREIWDEVCKEHGLCLPKP